MTQHAKTLNEKGEHFCGRCKEYHPISAFYLSNKYSCTASFRSFAKVNQGTTDVIPTPDTFEKDYVDQMISLLRMHRPDLKLSNPYQYTRPDAYDNHLKITVTGSHIPTIPEIMTKNIQRIPEYIKLKHSIESCKNAIQLKQLSNSVIAYHKANKEGSGELLADYVSKEDKLFVE